MTSGNLGAVFGPILMLSPYDPANRDKLQVCCEIIAFLIEEVDSIFFRDNTQSVNSSKRKSIPRK